MQTPNSKCDEITPVLLSSNLRITGAEYIDVHNYSNGRPVPIYEVSTPYALNQLIGHAKYNNRDYGTVLYRGECKLHDSLIPSLFRKRANASKPSAHIAALLKDIQNDKELSAQLKFTDQNSQVSHHAVEGLLQHYGIQTRYLDVVDNHWIALWMGLHNAHQIKKIRKYVRYERRRVATSELLSLIEGARQEKDPCEDDLTQYILLIAIPSSSKSERGVQESHSFIRADLRQAIPSFFLRPHAQHGIVVRKKVHATQSSNAYDIAPAVVGIIKLRVDRVNEWMGSGSLLTQENLFPPPAFDYGYDLLLSKSHIFERRGFSIVRYI